jgi:hypothetical protein
LRRPYHGASPYPKDTMEDVIPDDKVLSGLRVLEVAAWTFVPSTEEVLMDAGMAWDVIEKYKEAGAIL